MSVLPNVPQRDFGDKQARYLTDLVRRIELELRARPRRQQDGAVYIEPNSPLHIISPNGTVYRIEVTDLGAIETTEVTA